jgi:eukaryotic-like serine/threonine-protein kinase
VKVIAGRYEITHDLGTGTLSKVLRAWDKSLARDVAIRVIRKDLGLSQEDFEALALRLHNEARAQAALYHPNVAPIYDVGDDPELGVYLVSPFFDGQTLREWVRQPQKDLAQAATIALAMGEALSAAHEAGVLHRDLKPECVFLQRHGVVLADFGTSRLTDTVVSHLNIPPSVYTSPEATSRGVYTARNDQYALAVCLAEMLTGQVPSEAGQGLHGVDLSAFPAAAKRALLRGCAKKAEERFESCRALCESFALALPQDRTSTGPDGITATERATPSPPSVGPQSMRALASGPKSVTPPSSQSALPGRLSLTPASPEHSDGAGEEARKTSKIQNILTAVGLVAIVVLFFARSHKHDAHAEDREDAPTPELAAESEPSEKPRPKRPPRERKPPRSAASSTPSASAGSSAAGAGATATATAAPTVAPLDASAPP